MIAWGCTRPLEAHQSAPLATQICGLKMISCVSQIAATAFHLLQRPFILQSWNTLLPFELGVYSLRHLTRKRCSLIYTHTHIHTKTYKPVPVYGVT